MKALFLVPLLLAATPAAAQDFTLGLPIACEFGKTCWVQQYPDHDPTQAARDYACGAQTYDGHDGTDIRIRDTAALAYVLAAADGTVRAIRDGVDDHLMRTAEDRAKVGNRECGNGIVISHDGGWETQYCHLRKGTVTVKSGDKVAAGQPLGAVGYSGMAAFPHVHLTVRKDGEALDPFRSGSDGNCGGPEHSLWSSTAQAALAYQPGAILRGGFSPGPVELPELEAGAGPSIASTEPDASWPALVSYVWAINLQQDDEITVSIEGPEGFTAKNSERLDRAKAQYMLFAGKKQPAGGWPKGRYMARVEIRNGGTIRIADEWQAEIE